MDRDQASQIGGGDGSDGDTEWDPGILYNPILGRDYLQRCLQDPTCWKRCMAPLPDVNDGEGGWDEERRVLCGHAALTCLHLATVDGFNQNQGLVQTLRNCQGLRMTMMELNSQQVQEGLTLCKSLVNLNLLGNKLTFIPEVICSLLCLKSLNLSYNYLTEIPSGIKALAELKDVDLSHNLISDITSLSQCIKLRRMSLQCNNLVSIPALVGKLKELEEIGLSYNPIHDYGSLVDCTKLRKLSLRGNELVSIPVVVGKLKELQEIDLSVNRIIDFGLLVCCTKLRVVSLNQNSIRKIPAEVGKLKELEGIDLGLNLISDFGALVDCTKLRAVSLANNCITSIPSGIGNMKELMFLHLINGPRVLFENKNDICKLPDEVCQLKKLEVFTLESNSLCQLPLHIDQCDSLCDMRLADNPLTRPPVEVCDSGIEAIFQYFKDLRQSESRVRKQQVVFLGETGAGKTSLARTLIHNQSCLADSGDRTRVLDKYVWKVNNDLQLQITDFGGHHVYKLVHTFFLGSEVIASLVVDLSRYVADNYVNVIGRWLTTLMTMSWKSTVIVVGTHSDRAAKKEINRMKKDLLLRIKDQHHRMITDVEKQLGRIKTTMQLYAGSTEFQGYVRYLEDIRRRKERHLESLRSNFHVVENIFVTSASSMHGVPEFQSQLLAICEEKASVLPSSWLAIQDSMDDGELSDEPCITLEKFCEIVHRGFTVCGLQTDDVQRTATALLSYQHRIGNYLWFEEDDQLKEYVFHRPDFVVEFLKGIFCHNMDGQLNRSNRDFDFTKEGFKKAKEDFLKCGHISTDILQCLVKRHVSDESLFTTLVHLLEKFSLCFPVRKVDRVSILCFPWFLANDQPDEMQMKWRKNPDEHQYQIEFHFSMQSPEAFFELAIVRVHQCFGPFLQDVVTWKNGVYLRKDCNKIRMSKECDDDDVIVRLAVRGEQVKSLWSSLMKAYHAVVGLLVSKWPGSSYDVFYVCPHCLCSEVVEPTLYPAHYLQKFLSGEEFLPCANSDKGMVKVNDVVPGPFSVPSDAQLFETDKGLTDICQQTVQKCSIVEGRSLPASSTLDFARRTTTSTPQAAQELHYQLLKAIDDYLVDEDLGRLKAYCGLWIVPAQLQHITNTRELLSRLQTQGVIEVGNYSKLISMLDLHDLGELKEKVEKLANEIAKHQ